MAKYLLLFIAISISVISFAQKITVKKDTIYVDGKKSGILKTIQKQPLRYSICTLDGKALINIHYSGMEIKGQPGYIITFLNDDKQAMMTIHSKNPVSFISEIVKHHLLLNDVVNEQAEASFLHTYPLPEGYTDVDKLIEY